MYANPASRLPRSASNRRRPSCSAISGAARSRCTNSAPRTVSCVIWGARADDLGGREHRCGRESRRPWRPGRSDGYRGPGDVRRADLEHGQHGDVRVGRPVEQQRDPVAPAGAVQPQVAGELVGPGVELVVGQSLVAGIDRELPGATVGADPVATLLEQQGPDARPAAPASPAPRAGRPAQAPTTAPAGRLRCPAATPRSAGQGGACAAPGGPQRRRRYRLRRGGGCPASAHSSRTPRCCSIRNLCRRCRLR